MAWIKLPGKPTKQSAMNYGTVRALKYSVWSRWQKKLSGTTYTKKIVNNKVSIDPQDVMNNTTPLVDCMDLPDPTESTGFMESFKRKFIAAFQALKVLVSKKDFWLKILKSIIEALWDKLLEKILEMITEFFGLAVVKIIKVFWQATKLLMAIGKASKKAYEVKSKWFGRNEVWKEISKLWGEALGRGVHILLILLNIDVDKLPSLAKRRFK